MKNLLIKLLTVLLAFTLAFTTLFGCQPKSVDGGKEQGQEQQQGQEEEPQGEEPQGEDVDGLDHATVTLTDFTDPVPTMSVAYQNYLQRDYKNIRNEGSDFSYGQINLEFSVTYEEGFKGKGLYLSLSENADMSDKKEFPRIVVSKNKSSYYPVYNLTAGKTYYWQGRLVYVKEGQTTERYITTDIHSFTTSGGIPYSYYVGGATNVREMGGYPTNDGKTVKRGMLFRSGNFDKINSVGIETVKNVMKIKTEIDLRIDNSNPHAYVDGVGYLHFGMNSSSTKEFFPQGKTWQEPKSYILFNLEAIKNVFDTLADESNYPIDYHCAIGTDRTGVIAFLVEALLDVETEWLYRDYLLSNYANIGSSNRSATTIDTYIAEMNTQTGATFQQKTYNYLSKVVGVSTQNLDKIISILKG